MLKMQPIYGNSSDGQRRLMDLLKKASQISTLERSGRVVELIGIVIESEGSTRGNRELCLIESDTRDEPTFAEVVGFEITDYY
jgi:flagellar biosynthesis/type III secretory pathway ATPase